MDTQNPVIFLNKLKNFIDNDPIIDLFEQEFKINKEHSLFSKYIHEQKQKFTDIIIHYIKDNNIRSVVVYDESSTKEKKPILGILANTKDLHRISEGFSSINGDTCYITIEYSTIQLNKNGHVSDTQKQRFYNFKNWYIRKKLEEKYSITIDNSYIIGRKYKLSNRKDIINNAFFFADNPHDYTELLSSSIEHLVNVLNNSYKIGVNIFPNMKHSKTNKWMKEKNKISKKIGEITSIWRCSLKYRNEMINNKGITDYKKLKIFPNNIVKKIIKNKKTDLSKFPRLSLLTPRIYYVDFEILTNINDDFSSFPKSNERSFIFNIGCGYEVRNNFRFKSWICEDLDDERKIFEEFLDTVDGGTIVYWTDIEKRYILNKMEEYNLECNIQFFDLYKFFIDNEIIIKNCKNYKLKNVATSLYKDGLIKCNWSNGKLSSGLEAMVSYIEYLKTKDYKIIKNIVEYNRIDCKVLYEIMMLFRAFPLI